MTTVFFYARLWRRLGVLTDLEFYEMRYSGPAATWCAASAPSTSAFFFNCVIMATVNLAAAKIANVLLGWPMGQTLLVCSVLNIAFAATSGLWGVLVTDFIQFGIAMAGSFAAAFYALQRPRSAGSTGCSSRSTRRRCACCPTSATGTSRSRCSSSRSPCSGGRRGIRAPSRAAAATSRSACWRREAERDALAGTLFFNVAHYALRPWPWIIVALASMLVFPTVADIRRALPHVDPALIGHDMAYPAMLTFLPPGVLGLMVAGLLAAYVSTISTHLNWGTSYLVHDFYRRFLRPGADERHYVLAGRARHRAC